ncbi:MAG: CHRD domain-containing protein [Planctomycetota bacterium]
MYKQNPGLPVRIGGAALFVLALSATPAPAQTISWCITCTGPEAGNNSPAKAYGTVKLDTSNNFLSWDIAIKDLVGSQTISHLHSDTTGGGIAVNLGSGNPLTGVAPITANQADDLRGGNWYINIHSQAHTGGEVKGQVDDICATTIWCVRASESEEVPPTGSNGTAAGTITLDGATNSLSWNITHQGLSGNVTAAHLHGPAVIGQDGPTQVNMGVGNPVMGSAFIDSTQALQLRCGLWYVNLHTSMFGGGEIRGQVDDFSVDPYCSGLANSFSIDGARLTTVGDFTAANDSLVFHASGVPPGKFGYLLVGQGTVVVHPPGSEGAICLAGSSLGRYPAQGLTADNAGGLGPFTPDILTLPNNLGTALVGETWNFQCWFRDVGNTSNFTDAVAVTFE